MLRCVKKTAARWVTLTTVFSVPHDEVKCRQGGKQKKGGNQDKAVSKSCCAGFDINLPVAWVRLLAPCAEDSGFGKEFQSATMVVNGIRTERILTLAKPHARVVLSRLSVGSRQRPPIICKDIK